MASHTRTPLFKAHAQPPPRPHTTARGAPRGLESSCMYGTCSGGRTARRNVDRAGAVLRQSPNWGMRTRKRPSRQCALIYIHRRPGHQTAPPSLPLNLGPQLSRVTTTTRLAEPRECGLSHTAIIFSKQQHHHGPPQQQRRTSTTAVFSVVRRPWISPLSSAMCWLRTPQTRRDEPGDVHEQHWSHRGPHATPRPSVASPTHRQPSHVPAAAAKSRPIGRSEAGPRQRERIPWIGAPPLTAASCNAGRASYLGISVPRCHGARNGVHCGH